MPHSGTISLYRNNVRIGDVRYYLDRKDREQMVVDWKKKIIAGSSGEYSFGVIPTIEEIAEVPPKATKSSKSDDLPKTKTIPSKARKSRKSLPNHPWRRKLRAEKNTK